MKDFRNEARTHREKLMQNHRVRLALDSMQAQANRLVRTPPPPQHGKRTRPSPSLLCTRSALWLIIGANFLQIHMYEDKDGSRKEDIAALKGSDPVV